MKQVLCLFMMTIVCSGVAFAETLPPHTAKIGKGVYSFGNPANAYFSMFVVTNEGVIAIESVNTNHATEMVKAIRAVTDKPIRYLLHSHNHWDHSSGGQVFHDAGATVMAHEEAYQWMKANPGPDMMMPDESWKGNRKDITLGGTVLELHYLGMNHGMGMTVFLLPKQRIAYIADLVDPHQILFTVVPDLNVRELERSLKEIEQMDFDKAIYAHNGKAQPLLGGTKQEVRDYIQFVQDIRDAIHAELEKGTDWMMVANTVKLPKYKDWWMYEEWLPMNVWRILLDESMGPFPWRPE